MALAQVLGEQYNLFTAENACKWSPTEPQEDQFNLTGCRYIREQARRSNAVMRGHNLCWGSKCNATTSEAARR